MHVREEMPDAKIVAIPGPSALTAALSIAGITETEFLFLGFLPHKKGRQTLHKEIAETERAVVMYESPHRIIKLLGELQEFGSAERKVSIAREITKIYEEMVSGTPAELLNYFESNTEKERGEFVVIVHPK